MAAVMIQVKKNNYYYKPSWFGHWSALAQSGCSCFGVPITVIWTRVGMADRYLSWAVLMCAGHDCTDHTHSLSWCAVVNPNLCARQPPSCKMHGSDKGSVLQQNGWWTVEIGFRCIKKKGMITFSSRPTQEDSLVWSNFLCLSKKPTIIGSQCVGKWTKQQCMYISCINNKKVKYARQIQYTHLISLTSLRAPENPPFEFIANLFVTLEATICHTLPPCFSNAQWRNSSFVTNRQQTFIVYERFQKIVGSAYDES